MGKSLPLLLSLILLLAGKCFSQEPTQIVHVDSISVKKGMILDKGWKFHAGDNPQWGNVDFDDRSWQPIDPTRLLHQLPEVKETGLCWFRLKFRIDSSLLNERLAMILNFQGAAEIYLNGKQIYRFGTVSADFKTEQTKFVWFRPFSLKLGNQQLQQLAVRYSFHKKNLYINISMTASCMQIELKDNNQALTDFLRTDRLTQNVRAIQLTFYLPLAFLMLFLFLSYRLQKEYLYFGIFSLLMFLGMLMAIIPTTEIRSANWTHVYSLVQQFLLVSGLTIFYHGCYILFKRSKGWIFRFVVAYAFLIFPALFIFHDYWSEIILNCFIPLVILDFLRLSLSALQQRKPGVLILVITAALCLLLTIGTITMNLMEWYLLGYYCYSILFVVPPLGLSIFFAGEFARTALALQARVVEVENLSEKTIAQEKEKQQILASQNITLETQVRERTVELIQQQQALEIEKEAKLLAEFNRKFSESELKALRSQMNPHFVFNILNTIESYALENNKESASAMIQRFSRLTRLVLENSMSQLVPFQNDWTSLQLYVELEQMRYADDFRVIYNVQDQILDGEYLIPPMIIQPFVENAIIHGLRNKADHGGILNLSARLQDEFIIVEVQDNGIGRARAAELKGNNSIQKKSLGIKITQDRM
jgi:sensor histidine kinase YesM